MLGWVVVGLVSTICFALLGELRIGWPPKQRMVTEATGDRGNKGCPSKPWGAKEAKGGLEAAWVFYQEQLGNPLVSQGEPLGNARQTLVKPGEPLGNPRLQMAQNSWVKYG